MQNKLLIQPVWPIPSRKKNTLHHSYFPVGLLKLSQLFKEQGHNVEFEIGNQLPYLRPDEIYITSLFTYWSSYVINTAMYYRGLFPEARIIIGGPYVTLMNRFQPAHLDLVKGFAKVDEMFIGLYHDAEDCLPDLSLVPDIPFSVLHTTRGCIRRCQACGTWVLEEQFTWKESIAREIVRNNVATYDNNLLAHPDAEYIFGEMAAARVNGKVVIFESQSGFDARVLVQKPHLAKLIKKARFIRPRIAWDNGLDEYPVVEEAISLLHEAGYPMKEIMVFVLYNFTHQFDILEHKRKTLGQLGVQISDCRYRPLDALQDNYKPGKLQEPGEYYVHPGWTDNQIKEYRRRVRGQNIMVRRLRKGQPIDKGYLLKNNVPETVINEFELRLAS